MEHMSYYEEGEGVLDPITKEPMDESLMRYKQQLRAIKRWRNKGKRPIIPITIGDIAKAAHTSVSTVYRYCKAKGIKPARLRNSTFVELAELVWAIRHVEPRVDEAKP